jgi:hypothetical protein
MSGTPTAAGASSRRLNLTARMLELAQLNRVRIAAAGGAFIAAYRANLAIAG